ncbi:hypothetical protein JTB14_018706 [Gonioctena quinquepunctata]|nr:hypothetical protein JTB14_018706 [Gonioctena quinquepunctata]
MNAVLEDLLSTIFEKLRSLVGKSTMLQTSSSRSYEDGRPWIPTIHICSSHFVGGEKSEDPRKEAYNSTIFPDIYKKLIPDSARRGERVEARNRRILIEKSQFIPFDANNPMIFEDRMPLTMEIGIQTDPYEPESSKMPTILFCSLDESQISAGTQTIIPVNNEKNDRIILPEEEDTATSFKENRIIQGKQDYSRKTSSFHWISGCFRW